MSESTVSVSVAAKPADADVREQALNPQQSYIVQAPAGSGKTELLTRRVLTLLATVDEPEDVLAITFTRKAASEMRLRVLNTLQAAASGVEPGNDYEKEGFALANAVLERDKQLDWQLLQNAQRLNMKTIDALSTTLAHRLPVVSELGAPTATADDPYPMYRLAAERLLDQHANKLDLLLLQLGNRQELAQTMLAELLGNRDQWRGYAYSEMSSAELRAVLEYMLFALIESKLKELEQRLPHSTKDVLPRLLRETGQIWLALEPSSPAERSTAENLTAINNMPGTSVDQVVVWEAIANTLLTGINTKPAGFRKSLTKKVGYPVAAADAKLVGQSVEFLKERKAQMLEVLAQLSADPALVELLDDARRLPAGGYTDSDWALLEQLLGMLPVLLEELQLVFAEKGAVDFVEMALRAQRALGSDDNPTDLALALDMRIKHILVDEFQDTSRTQFEFYKLLVAGWQPDDGRTFFAVGDPMQSIYRFREGDVTLFAQAQQQGIGQVELQPLTLTVNFRAAPAVVDWVNTTFKPIFPSASDEMTGAVPYAESVAHLSSSGEVKLHALVDPQAMQQANQVALLTEQALQVSDSSDTNAKKRSVAILIRSRAQAIDIFTALQSRNIAYQSVELELLGNRQVVRDIVALSLALRYPHDRLNWLSVLRSPLCGLSLIDLHALMDDSAQHTVFDLLRNADRYQALSEDGKSRVDRVLQVLQPAVRSVSRSALMPWVESAWLQLGGPCVCRDKIDLDAAERCIARLQQLEQSGMLWQPSVLRSAMESLYASAGDDNNAQVQVMTLHKSKGLEFDTVILPCLEKRPRIDQQKLINWFEAGSDANTRMLLAPITERGLASNAADKINLLVRQANKRCEQQEKLRLLYVACTRAKQKLHLLADVKTNAKDGELAKPVAASLLHPLWFLFEPEAARNALSPPSNQNPTDEGDQNAALDDDSSGESVIVPKLQRLPADWTMPPFTAFEWPEDSVREQTQVPKIDYAWAGTLARDIGTVVHDQLQVLSHMPQTQRQASINNMRNRIELQLLNLGVSSDRLEQAAEKVQTALSKTLTDERGQWILSLEHTEARSEWALSAPVNGIVKRMVIDRTFIDDNDVRWIVDYKTGDHQGGDVEHFLDTEQERYSEQLSRYASVIKRIENREVKCGLYFPLLQAWREFDPETPSADNVVSTGSSNGATEPAITPEQTELKF
jgi:ATP-dependent exoDNAse (exonuclease V) beta subunit